MAAPFLVLLLDFRAGCLRVARLLAAGAGVRLAGRHARAVFDECIVEADLTQFREVALNEARDLGFESVPAFRRGPSTPRL